MVAALACLNEYTLFTAERREGGMKCEKEGEREEGRERKSNYIERENIEEREKEREKGVNILRKNERECERQ